MSKYQVNNHSVLNVQNEEAKQGASWHDIARRRAVKQHGDSDEIPEGDIHAVRKHHDQHIEHSNPEETQRELTSLEEKIKQLQHHEEEKKRMQPPPPPPQQYQNYSEDPYEDWYKE